MGQMKYVYMLMQQNRIQELEHSYKQALDAEEEHFIFDSNLIHTAKAKAIIDYANQIHIDDSINSSNI
jgi:hypothetical protein